MPKHVASRSLKGPLEWSASLIKGNIVEEIRKLKEQPGTDLVQYGVGELTHTMLEAGLIDEIRVLILPFTYGEGARIFDHMGVNSMKLIKAKTFESGAVALWYQPQKTE
ncbi:MAG TPA: dihydrofolate reductase family protein [Candidatus Saccharimonadales bacterium]|nr:dihydrofolate reductase family protein [Candidatus Saccharimonadales bacterium]